MAARETAAASHDRSTRRRRRARWGVACAVSAALVGGLSACASGPEGTVINLYGGASQSGFEKIIAECNAAAGGKYTIVGNLTPSDADGQREQLVRRLAAKDAGMDLLGMDVTWTAEFAEAKWIRELDQQQTQAATAGVLKPAVETAMWQDKMYAIPKHTNVQLLWYRKSLVPTPPKTWDEMIQMAQKLKADGQKTYQIGITGGQYEGYVVNINNFLNMYGATVVNEDSTQATVGDKTVEALAMMKKVASSGVTSASLSNNQEPEIFAELQNGQSAFSVNWPYVYAAMGEASPEVQKDLGFAPMPTIKAGEEPKVTLGGMNFAISQYSKHPQEAYEAAMCMRDEKHQLMHSTASGEPAVLEALYKTPEMQKVYPMADEMLKELQNASPRPVTPLYQNISTIISSTLSPPGSINPQADAQELQEKIQQAIDGKGILP